MANDQTVAPVFSFQKLTEAALGNGAATLTLESGETIAPQMSLRFAKDEAQ